METAESQRLDLGMEQSHVSSSHETAGDQAAEPKFESQPDHTAEIVTTPTEAAAAGDIHIELDKQEDGGSAQADEKGDGDKVTMGNTGSGDVTVTQFRTITEEKVPMKEMGQNGAAKKDLDDLFPATNLTTSDFDGKVKLRVSDTGYGAIKPTTIQNVMMSTVQKLPNGVAMAVKRGGQWQRWTYQQYYNQAQQAAKAFISIGLEPNHAVGILGFNSPEWFISYIGGIFAGGKSTGIYTTNTPEACQYVLHDCQANVVVVENNIQLQKILKVWESLPHLKAIVQYTGEVAERRENIYSWEEFLKLSQGVPDSALQDRTACQAPNTCCSLIYTSGTTGNPKAVMISHDNCTWTAERTGNQLGILFGKEVYVSFLPLSHIAAQMLDILIPIRFGIAIYFAQPDALKGTLGDTWKEVRPTGVLAVPRVWEKIQEKMVAVGKSSSSLKKKIAVWAKGKGLKGSYAQMKGERMPFGWSVANMLVFKKVRAALGLDRCRNFGSAAAPITKETLDFFASLNIRLDECYGMSESSGPHTFATTENYRITSVGKELQGVITKLENPDKDGNGEICYWGRHIFMGYLNQREKTKEAVDDQGWLHSGDIGKKDEDGFLYITGRIKELIITAGGENIPPVSIEENVKEALPVVSNCMLIGDKRKFLSMLITLKTDMNLETNEPLPTLTEEAKEWCRSVGSSARTVQEVMMDQNIIRGIQAGIDVANEKAVSRAAKIQKWSILPADFSIPGGELGPTLKLRRPIVVKMYEKTIAAFYEE